MPGSGDSSSGSGVRSGSLIIRRAGDTYQFELDLPSPGGGVRPGIWSGTRRIPSEVWAELRGALESAGQSLLRRDDEPDTATTMLSEPLSALEQLGELMHRTLLPDEVREELARYAGPLLLAVDDPSLPWEVLHDGRDYLGLRQPVGRRLVVSRRRSGADQRSKEGGALLIGNPSGDLPEAERELEMLSELLAPLGTCTVLAGPRASKEVVAEILSSGGVRLVHFVGGVRIDAEDPLNGGLVLRDGQVLTSGELREVLQGEPFVFLNARRAGQDGPTYLGAHLATLASALADGGARGVVGTLWSVYDAGSRQLAIEFYRRAVEGIPGGEALRQARRAVRARRGDESTWSGYVLYGDPGLAVLPAARTPAVTLRPRIQFGPFHLEEEVGRGGMGIVWKAYQPSLDRYVALKFLASAREQDGQSRERFKREARLIARLRHPNLLQVYDFDEEQGYLFLVTEYVPGGTMQDLLRREGVLRIERVVELLGPVANALDELHRQGMVHRDVKPSNILLDANGTPILGDCGVARLLDEATHMTATGAMVGTPTYMSPEQAAGQEASPASDQYSLGVLAFQALTGRAPFEAPTPVATALAHLQQAPPSPRELNPRLNPAVEGVLLRALAKPPEDRYPSCDGFIAALNRAMAEVTTRFDPPPTDGPAARAAAAGEAAFREATLRPVAAAVQTPPPRVRDTAVPVPTPPVRPAVGTGATVEAPGGGTKVWVPTLIGAVAILAALAFMASQLNLFGGSGTTGTAAATWTAGPAATSTVSGVAGPVSAPVGLGAASGPAQPASTATALPATSVPTVVPPTSVPTAVPPTATLAPPTATPLPPALADWSALLARLDGGVWANDLPQAARLLEEYVQKYKEQNPPQLALAREKLYAASVELGKRAVGASDFEQARGRYGRALEQRPDDPLAQGELKKVNLWLAGDEAYRRQDWAAAVASWGELASIDSGFGNVGEKLTAAQVELAKTWTPTPVPAPPAPAPPANTAPRSAPPQTAPRSAPPQTAPRPAPQQSAPAPAPAPAPSGGDKPIFTPPQP